MYSAEYGMNIWGASEYGVHSIMLTIELFKYKYIYSMNYMLRFLQCTNSQTNLLYRVYLKSQIQTSNQNNGFWYDSKEHNCHSKCSLFVFNIILQIIRATNWFEFRIQSYITNQYTRLIIKQIYCYLVGSIGLLATYCSHTHISTCDRNKIFWK